MPNRENLETRIASVMEILAKAAVVEICKVVDSGCVELRLEMCRRQKEIDALRKELHCLTTERSTVRGAPQRRTVGVQIDTDQDGAGSRNAARGPVSSGPGPVKTEEHKSKPGPSDGEEFALDFSVSEVDFPLWAPEMLSSGGSECETGEGNTFSVPSLHHSPGNPLNPPADPHQVERPKASSQCSSSPQEKPSCEHPMVLPQANHIKVEDRGQCPSSSSSAPSSMGTTSCLVGHSLATWDPPPPEINGIRQALHDCGGSRVHKQPDKGSVGPGWGKRLMAGEGSFLCSRCGQSFPCYQQLQTHKEVHAADSKDNKHAASPLNGAFERESSDKLLQRTAEEELWNSEVERKLQLELQRLQDSFPAPDADCEDPRTQPTHRQDVTSSPHAHSYPLEPLGFAELQLQLKTEQIEEQVDHHALPLGACEYQDGNSGQIGPEFRLTLPTDASESRDERAAWQCLDTLKHGMSLSSHWANRSGRDHLHRRVHSDRPDQNMRCLTSAIPQSTAPPAKRRPVFSPNQTFPSSSSSSSSASASLSSSLIHRRFFSTAGGPLAVGTTLQRLFRCPMCPKSFGRATDLERHQRIHTGERPFGCGVCGKRFSLRCNLVTHERVHSGSKPFACRHCGKRFAQASNMKAHQRIHTGERPFRCSLCSRSFTQLSSLKTHQRLHSRT